MEYQIGRFHFTWLLVGFTEVCGVLPRPLPPHEMTSNVNAGICTWPWSAADGLLPRRAECLRAAQSICSAGRGQTEPLGFLFCPTELCLFGVYKTLKCFGKYTVKRYDRNICNGKNSGNRATSLECFRLHVISTSQTSVASWFMYTALRWHWVCWSFPGYRSFWLNNVYQRDALNQI